MKKLDTARQLHSRLETLLNTVEREFSPLTDTQLAWKPAPDKWSIAECLQHLNLAERYYIRNIQHKIDQPGVIQPSSTDQILVSDWVGKLLRWAVDPTVKLKLKAPSSIKPRPGLNPRTVLNQFVELQQLLVSMLDKTTYLDWNQDKLATLFGNWLKIRLGDALLMLVAHTERHINQAMRVKEGVSL